MSARPLALVTGASGGIGLEFARILAADGYDCVLVARSRERLEFMAADIREKHGVAVTCIAADLTRDESIAELTAAIPRCDLLVNNAGLPITADMPSCPRMRSSPKFNSTCLR